MRATLAALGGFICVLLTQPASGQMASDTVIQSRGASIRIVMWDGSVRVRTGDAGQVRIRATRDSSVRVALTTAGDSISLASSSRRRNDNVVAYEIIVPPMSPIRVIANDAEVFVDGPIATIALTAQHGRADLRGIRVRTVVMLFRGPITIRDAGGSVEATTLRGDIEIQNVRGNVSARNTDGHIHLRDVNADSLVANSVDGEVAYAGLLREGGVYRLTSHNQRVRLNYAPNAGASIYGTAVSGAFSRPEQWRWRAPSDSLSRQMTIGRGGATVRLMTFKGAVEVSVLRPLPMTR